MNFQDPASTTTHRSADRTFISPAKRRRVMVTVTLVAFGLLAALVAFQLVRQSTARARLAANRPPALSVNFEIVKPVTLPQSLGAVGSLAAVNRATLSVEAGGTVTRIAFAPGAHVNKGDLLVQLNDSSEQADLASFRAQQRFAHTGLDRTRQLARTGNAAVATLDQNQSQTDVASAGTSRADSAVAKKALRAPFEGDVGLNLVDLGEYVTPGTPVVQLTDKSRLYLNFNLPEQTRPKISIGQQISFTVDAFPGETFVAKIAVIDPEVEESTRALHVHGVAENTDGRLMPGMYAAVQVPMGEMADVLMVPETSISYSLSGNSLFLAVPGEPDKDGKPTLKAKKVAVRTGMAENGRLAVLSGLSPGDQVITSGQIKLFDGSPVILKTDAGLTVPATPTRY